jgi:hypothetical protein
MIRKILYIIAVAWGLAFIWQTYAHADELPKLPKDFTKPHAQRMMPSTAVVTV